MASKVSTTYNRTHANFEILVEYCREVNEQPEFENSEVDSNLSPGVMLSLKMVSSFSIMGVIFLSKPSNKFTGSFVFSKISYTFRR